jgi:hypothetical protein
MQCQKIINLALVLIGLFLSASCSVRDNRFTFLSPVLLGTADLPIFVPGRTETPLATTAKLLASTPVMPAETSSVNGPCITLDQLKNHIGNAVCLESRVLTTENWGNDFVMWLDENPATVYVVIRNTFYLGIEGSCLRVMGTVEMNDKKQFFIRADDPGQVAPCHR